MSCDFYVRIRMEDWTPVSLLDSSLLFDPIDTAIFSIFLAFNDQIFFSWITLISDVIFNTNFDITSDWT